MVERYHRRSPSRSGDGWGVSAARLHDLTRPSAKYAGNDTKGSRHDKNHNAGSNSALAIVM